MKYPKQESGEATRLNLSEDNWALACCDCGMVHIIQFHHIEGDVWDIACFSQPRRTAQLRRHNYGNLQTDHIRNGSYYMNQCRPPFEVMK